MLRTQTVAGVAAIVVGLGCWSASAVSFTKSKPDVPAVVIEIANPCRDAIQAAAQYRASTYSMRPPGRWQADPVTIRRANRTSGGQALCRGDVDLHRHGGRWDGAALALACTLNLRQGVTGRWLIIPATLNCHEDFYPDGLDELPGGGGDYGPDSFPPDDRGQRGGGNF